MAWKVASLWPALLLALCFHEYAHGFVAKLKGDNTAEMMGRLTMNPMAHMDIVGTVALPILAIASQWGFLFGWAKPVPVNPRNLRRPKEDMFWIALAGPLSNVLLAFVGALALFLLLMSHSDAPAVRAGIEVVNTFIYLNFILAVFNLLPFHPLDGGKVIARFLPPAANQFLEDQQQILQVGLILMFVLGGFRYLAVPIHWLYSSVVNVVIHLVMTVS
ncbi:MAG: site-2 protease family protein [Pseudobdellovibrionaceae bacterium]|nr:site-2 protease family protein [Bdellovibrionales bacterium]USN48948.1 MAG: site-2 protease family protein [Pseudobdellovibrionaceae bacterium]